jgi:hypothetical protein
MKRLATRFLLVLLPLGSSSCDILGPTVCTTEAVPAIIVEVRDAGTQAPAANGATGYARDGDVEVVLENWDPQEDALTLVGAYERAGTYSVTVEKPGYQSWKQGAVVVTRGECHVRTARLTANLQPIS